MPTTTPGPVHLDLVSVNGYTITDGEADLEVIVEQDFSQVPPFRPEPELFRMRAALELLTQAQRPIIVAGGGVYGYGASLTANRRCCARTLCFVRSPLF